MPNPFNQSNHEDQLRERQEKLSSPKPCPFCGHTDTVFHQVQGIIYCIRCIFCCARGPEIVVAIGDEQQLATELWNKRT